MRQKQSQKPGYGRLLDAWVPPSDSGEPLGCVATSYTFSSTFFEEECLGRFVQLESDAAEDGAAFLVEREEKFAQLVCASALVDQRHAQGLRSLRWDLLAARMSQGILHAKVSLLYWTNAVRVIVASANITEDGYRRNQEVFGVLDYHPGSVAPLTVLDQLVDFLDQAADYVDPSAINPPPEVERWRSFLSRVRKATRTWGALPPSRSAPFQIHAITTGPNRPSVLDGVKAIWRGKSPPESVWVISPFFDPPDSVNIPARRIWEYLRLRGNAKVCYVLQGQQMDASGKVMLDAPESLRWRPPSPEVVLEFEQIECDPARPLHAKCMWFQGAEWFLYTCGSSNFTTAGLGLGTTRNLEANLAYYVNTVRAKEAKRQCEAAWPEHACPNDGFSLIPSSDAPEDAPGTGEPTLPHEFGSATFARTADGSCCIELIIHAAPKTAWQIFPDDDSARFFDDLDWMHKGCPTQIRLPWPWSRPPSGFRVVRVGIEGAAWWPVNVLDSAALPPPAELGELPLEVLIELLTSAKPLHLALKGIQARSQNRRGEAQAVAIDPHDRVDTSAFLLQRTRRVSWALSALRIRLERPVGSIESLRWRLDGPVGVNALAAAIDREARSDEERLFLIAELILELLRVEPTIVPGGLSLSEVRRALDETIAELLALLGHKPITHNLELRAYLDSVKAAVR